ncbi:MAG: HipA domain-containing protein [Bacteroidales bacterium]
MGKNPDGKTDTPASYLDMAEFISNYGANVDENLHQLWRRIVFNIAISNTDDHLRNHGFILTDEGWVLSPAFDLNPSTDKYRLALNIDMKSNALDFDLARSVGVFFRLTKKQMNVIIDDVLQSVHKWQNIADTIGIPRTEQKLMESVFNMSERT